MATIRYSEFAPQEDVRFLLGNEEIELSAGGTHETDDPAVIAAATAHEWLTVEVPASDIDQPSAAFRQVRPEDDVLSAQNSVAFDPGEIQRLENEKAEYHNAQAEATEEAVERAEELSNRGDEDSHTPNDAPGFERNDNDGVTY